ncbi:MAG: sirohydrochlorin cobaltochelatase [candidate division NC10 bacterium]|nr:sirohydrochlorin cobaltochelatase [candidate division NC10 bacterium]
MSRAILLVDHGSVKREANEMLADVAALLQRLTDVPVIRIAHMELAEPTISQGVTACVEAGATEITVHPYFLAPGRHSTTDIPRMVAEAAKNHPGVRVRVTAPLGLHEKICEVVLERVREVDAARTPTGGR